MIVFYTLSYYIIICSNLLYFWFVSYYMLLFHFLNYILLCYIVLEYAISCHNFLVVYYSTSYLFILIYIYIYIHMFSFLYVMYCIVCLLVGCFLYYNIVLHYIYIYDTYIISFVYIQNIRFITLYCNHQIGRVIQYILRVMYIFFMSFDGGLFSCDTYSLPVKSPRSGFDVPGTGPAWCRCGPRG